jgi:hypothetical protein
MKNAKQVHEIRRVVEQNLTVITTNCVLLLNIYERIKFKFSCLARTEVSGHTSNNTSVAHAHICIKTTERPNYISCLGNRETSCRLKIYMWIFIRIGAISHKLCYYYLHDIVRRWRFITWSSGRCHLTLRQMRTDVSKESVGSQIPLIFFTRHHLNPVGCYKRSGGDWGFHPWRWKQQVPSKRW